MDGEVHLGRPTLVRAGAQPVADHLFPPPDGGLDPSPFVVPGPLLPSHAPVLGNALEMAVALRRRGLGIRRWHRARTRRHDDGRLGVARGDAGVNTLLVVGSCMLMPLFLCGVVEAQAADLPGPEATEAGEGCLIVGEQVQRYGRMRADDD